jgi:hypothetical protein
VTDSGALASKDIVQPDGTAGAVADAVVDPAERADAAALS